MLVVIVVLGLAAVIALAMWNAGKNARRIAKVPRCPIGELPEATRARIVGHVVRHGLWAVAPLTHRPCVYWKVTLRVLEGFGRYARWRTVLTETGGVPFAIDDGTGRAMIDPDGAEAAIRVSHHNSARFGLRDRERDFLARHEVDPGGGLFRRKFRFEESIIAIGQGVAAVGAGLFQPIGADDPGTYREPPSRWLRIASRLCELELTDSPVAFR